MDTISLELAIAPVAALPGLSDPLWCDWLSPAELAYCGGLQRAGEHLAARALGKQVAADALVWTRPVPWRDMEIRRRPGCAPELVVVGELNQWCQQHQLAIPGVSLSHAAGHAAAVAWSGRMPDPTPVWR